MTKRRVENAVVETDSFWRGLFAQSSEGLMVVEIVRDQAGQPCSWRFLEINDAWERISGLSQADARGRDVRDVIPGIEQRWLDAYIGVAESGDPFQARMPLAALDQLYDVRATQIGNDRVAVRFQEVSAAERDKETRAALLELNDRLLACDDPSALADIACEVLGRSLDVELVGYGTIDPVAETITVARDWTSAGAQTLAGTLPFRSFGTYIEDLKRGQTVVVADARTDPRTSAHASALEARSARAFVNTPVFERGAFIALQYVSTIRPRAWRQGELDFIRDVADRTRAALARREAEQAIAELNRSLERQVAERTKDLERSRDRASTFFTSSDDYLFLIRIDAEGTVRFDDMNPACERVMGLERDEVIGRPVDSLLPGDSATDIIHYAHICLRSRERQTYLAVREYQAGQNSIIEGRVAFVEQGDDGSGLVLFSGRDVTEQRRTEDALRQSQKLEAIGQLTGGVAHDFNNLLTVIRGSVDLLRRAELPEEKRRRYVDAIGDTADRAAKLTGQLLAFARRQSLTPELFDAGASLTEVATMLRSMTGSRVALEIIIPADPFHIVADRSQFDTAIINMGINARDAMAGEGRLCITTGPVSGIPPIRGHAAVAGDFVAVTLTDSGPGVSEELLDRIFEPFFTTKPVGHGTGLGLSQVIGFAKQSGGDIRVDSRPGTGTTFTLYLPRAYPDGSAPAEERPGEEVDGTNVCVLVVEDNEQVGTFATTALAELGYDTVLATDGHSALQRLREGSGRFQVVFTDVVMPGMSGIELAGEVRKSYPDLPVILTSGYSHVLAQNGQHGFELLHKPYSIEQLARILRKTVNWRAQRR